MMHTTIINGSVVGVVAGPVGEHATINGRPAVRSEVEIDARRVRYLVLKATTGAVTVVASQSPSVSRLTVWDEVAVDSASLQRKLDESWHLDLRIARGTLSVPDMTDVEVRTVSADVVVEGLLLTVTAETTSGSVRVAAASRRVRVSTVSGDVDVPTMVPGTRADLYSISGSIRVPEGVVVDAMSVSGEVQVRLDDSGDAKVQARTVSGDVSYLRAET